MTFEDYIKYAEKQVKKVLIGKLSRLKIFYYKIIKKIKTCKEWN
jgi:hypothetical protein